MDQAPQTIQAISGITDTTNIRVLLIANGQHVHVPLDGILKPLTDKIKALESRLATAGL